MRLRRLAAVGAAMSMAVAAAVPASADSGGDRLKAARARAERLHEQATRQQAVAAAAQARLLTLSDAANAALGALQRARAAEAAAAKGYALERDKLAAATAARDAAALHISDYARDAYIAGPTGTGLGPALAVLQHGDPTEAMNALALLGKVGGGLGIVLNEMQVARHERAAAAAVAASAFASLQAAEQQQETANRAADAAVAAQAALLRRERSRAVAVAVQAKAADATAARLKRELDAEIAAARARAAAARAGALARCEGGDISGYPNGRIPIEKLCPLYGAAGEELREDAAARFNQMSRDYQSAFGAPICVADSYRTYERQQQLYASEPGYAAYPGTSQHGWALAVDLCGGVQSDGTPQNMWMRTHAAQYGWFHPTWADPDGGGPYEPWHWEFSG